MRKRCTRTVSLLGLIVFIGLSSSKAAQIPVAYGGSATPPGGQPDIEQQGRTLRPTVDRVDRTTAISHYLS